MLSEVELNIKFPEALHEILMKKVQEYALIGGMLEAIVKHKEQNNIYEVEAIFQSLTQSFYDEILKYIKAEKQNYIRNVLYSMSYFAGSEIVYKGFGESSFVSREISLAFQQLEDVGLLNRVYLMV